MNDFRFLLLFFLTVLALTIVVDVDRSQARHLAKSWCTERYRSAKTLSDTIVIDLAHPPKGLPEARCVDGR